MLGLPFGLEIDIWSFGVILMELYMKVNPFLAPTKLGVLKKVVYKHDCTKVTMKKHLYLHVCNIFICV